MYPLSPFPEPRVSYCDPAGLDVDLIQDSADMQDDLLRNRLLHIPLFLYRLLAPLARTVRSRRDRTAGRCPCWLVPYRVGQIVPEFLFDHVQRYRNELILQGVNMA